MLRQRKFEFIDRYREEAASAVKAIVKQVSTSELVPCDFGLQHFSNLPTMQEVVINMTTDGLPNGCPSYHKI